MPSRDTDPPAKMTWSITDAPHPTLTMHLALRSGAARAEAVDRFRTWVERAGELWPNTYAQVNVELRLTKRPPAPEMFTAETPEIDVRVARRDPARDRSERE